MNTSPASKVSVVSCVAFAAVLASCANDVEDGGALGTDDAVTEGGVIVGELDWVNVDDLPEGSAARRAARAAAYVSAPQAQARCSGFLIAPDVLMTNHHCIPGAPFAVGARAHFLLETTWGENGIHPCDEYIGGDADLDYALVRCEGRPGDTFGVLTLDAVSLRENDRIQLFHQQCDYYTYPTCEPTKKMSPGKIIGGIGPTRITHDADSLGGSSGGAIVAPNSTRVVALHNAHYLSSTNGRGTTNVGVPMTKILPHLREHFPGVLGGGAATCASVPASGRVIDEDDDCVTLGGNARYLRAIEGEGDGGDLVWTGTTTSTSPGNFATWGLRFDAAGRYEIAVALDASYGTATVARYRVRHGGVEESVTLSQAGRDGFVVLGAFDFAAGGSQSIRLDDNTGVRGEQIVFDAVRVRPAAQDGAPVAASCPRVRVTAATLNVRPQPNTQQAAVGALANGDVVDRLETTQGETVRGTSTWYRVEAPGVAGYISAAFATCAE